MVVSSEIHVVDEHTDAGIIHTQCGMAGLEEHGDIYIEVPSEGKPCRHCNIPKRSEIICSWE